MAKSRKNTRKPSVKVEDMAPAKNPKGGSKIIEALHEIRKSIVANFRV